MSPFGITVLFLVIGPLTAHGLYVAAKSKTGLRRTVRNAALIALGIWCLLRLTKISTTSEAADWIMAGLAYSAFLILTWQLLYVRVKWLKTLVIMGIIFYSGITLLSVTMGILGVGFIVADEEIEREVRLDKSYTYREYLQGNATSDFRRKEVTIHKRFSLLPFLERERYTKTYNEWKLVYSNFVIEFNPDSQNLKLKAELKDQDKVEHWEDVLNIP